MNGPIFDFHARLGVGPESAGRLLAAMDRSGISRAAVSSGGVIDLDRLATQVMRGGHVEADADNAGVLAGCAGAGGRLVPFYFGNPHRGADEYSDLAGRFRGLEISPAVHGVPLTDARTVELVRVAERAGHPVYVVCLGRPGCGPTDLAALAEAFPSVVFVLGHCGFVGIDAYSLSVVAPHGNVLAETSGCYTGIARIAVQRLGAERVLFGTEYPLQHPEVELTKLRALDLDESVWTQITWGNAVRLLGEPGGAPFPTDTEAVSHV